MAFLSGRLGHALGWALALCILLGASVYPTDLDRRYRESKNGQQNPFVMGVETVGRHVNTALPFVLVLATRDAVGLKQLAGITVVGILGSHGPKRLLNDVEVWGTLLGERPSSPSSKHNMPSGHATLASAGAYFVMRRYSFWFGLIVLPVLGLTMYARVMLDAHTVSATIAGAMTGMIVAALFARPTPRLRETLWALSLRFAVLTKM